MKSKQAMKRLSLPVLPAIMIAGSVSPAIALELGTIEVQSRLGEPLRASIAYALAPNEALADYCVSLAPLSQLNGLPAISGANIAVGNGAITITGAGTVNEPLLTARLEVNCPYTPKITREFMLFVDPAEFPIDSRFAAAPAVRNEPVARPQPQPRTPAPAREPITIGTSYRVQPGDSLSEIAMRLEDRQTGLWQAVNAIFQANPGAFIDEDPNQLKAGVVLEIPSAVALGQVAPEFAAANAAPAAATETVAESTPEPAAAAQVSDDTAYLAPAASVEATRSEAQLREPARMTVDGAAGLTPQSSPVAEAVAEAVSEMSSAAPAAIAPVPEADTASTVTTNTSVTPADDLPVALAADNSGSNAIWWSLGGALVVIGGLLFWRRRRTDEPVDIVAAVAARPRQPLRHLEEDSIEVEIIDSPEAVAALDYDLSDDSPTEENLVLDANLFEGDGLAHADSAEQADFAFAPTTELDLELEEATGHTPEETRTDIIPPPDRSAGSILESEVLPEEHDYDMSVILDATKTPVPDEATERDLKAVVIDDGDEEVQSGGDAYTVSQEVDYEILEQDYEEELTATQALNKEIERATRDLAADLDDAVTVESEMLSHEETTALPVASVTELDVTANLLAGNDDDSTAGDSAEFDEITVNLDADDKTVEMAASPGNREAGDDRNDQTVEMDLDPAKVDSRAG